jgi:hypothetical protein
VCESDDVEVVEPDMKEATLEIQRIEQFIHPSRVLTSYLQRIAYANDASYFRPVPQAVVQLNPSSNSHSNTKYRYLLCSGYELQRSNLCPTKVPFEEGNKAPQ